MGIKVTGNPVYSINLRDLVKNQRGFISSEEIRRIKKKYNAKDNCVVNVNAMIARFSFKTQLFRKTPHVEYDIIVFFLVYY